MLRCSTEREKIVAVLHDVVEDSTITIEFLREAGFDEGILKSVDCLTRDPSGKEGYEAYIQRCKGNTLARVVKIADLDDHLDNYTPGVVPDEHIVRYRRAYKALTQEDSQ